MNAQQTEQAAITFEPPDADKVVKGSLPTGKAWVASCRALGRAWKIWQMLCARALTTGEGVAAKVSADGLSVTISTVYSPLYHSAVWYVSTNGEVSWIGEQSGDVPHDVSLRWMKER